jgi:hypothetical protein
VTGLTGTAQGTKQRDGNDTIPLGNSSRLLDRGQFRDEAGGSGVKRLRRSGSARTNFSGSAPRRFGGHRVVIQAGSRMRPGDKIRDAGACSGRLLRHSVEGGLRRVDDSRGKCLYGQPTAPHADQDLIANRQLLPRHARTQGQRLVGIGETLERDSLQRQQLNRLSRACKMFCGPPTSA